MKPRITTKIKINIYNDGAAIVVTPEIAKFATENGIKVTDDAGNTRLQLPINISRYAVALLNNSTSEIDSVSIRTMLGTIYGAAILSVASYDWVYRKKEGHTTRLQLDAARITDYEPYIPIDWDELNAISGEGGDKA